MTDNITDRLAGSRIPETPPEYEYDLYDADKASSNDVGVDNFFTSGDAIAKSDRFERATAAKNRALENLSNKTSLDNSYTDLGNGWVESNRNKLWNDMSDQDIQSLYQHTLDTYSLTKDAEGNLVDSAGNAYNGRTRNLYNFGTKAYSNEVTKIGLSRGDKDPERRYTPGKDGYGWESGELGVETSAKGVSALLPYDVATMLEAATHGREKALQGRVVQSLHDNPELADHYGSGASEYYKSPEAVLGAPQQYNAELGGSLFDQYMARYREAKGGTASGRRAVYPSSGQRTLTTEEQIKAQQEDWLANRAPSQQNSVENAIKGFGATFVSELLVNPADAIGEATGTFDLGTEEEKSKYVNDAFGYDPKAAQEAMERVGAQWDIVSDDTASTGDRMRAAGNGILEAIVTPELLGTSLGAVLSWVTPGALFKAAGVGSKYANAAGRIDHLVKSGKLTRTAGLQMKAKRFVELDGAKGFLANQSGFALAAMGNVNNQYEEFVANNNGVELEGGEKAKWMAGRFAVQMFNQNLEKIVDFNIIKNPGMLAGLKPVFKSMTEKEFGNVVTGMAKGLATTTANMGAEAGQEYAQTMMELHNSRYGSEQFKDSDDFISFLTNEDNVREAGIASLAGAGGAVQFEALGTAGRLPVNAVSAIRDKLPKSIPISEAPAGTQSAADYVEQVKKTQSAKAVQTAEVNPEASYYSAQASDDAETKARSGQFAATSKDAFMDGSHSVYNSDKSADEQLAMFERISEIIKTEYPDISEAELMQRAGAGMRAAKGQLTPEEEQSITGAVAKGSKRGALIATIKKTMSEVHHEAAHGARGFTTYYAAAMAAQAEGNNKEYEEHVDRLGYFFLYEETKLARVETRAEEIGRFIEAEAEHLISTGQSPDRDQALMSLASKYRSQDGGKGKRDYVDNSDTPNGFTTFIDYSDVANKLRSPDYDKGTYKLINMVTEEVAAMKDLYGMTFLEQPPATPVEPSQEPAPAEAEPAQEPTTPPAEVSPEESFESAPDTADMPPMPPMEGEFEVPTEDVDGLPPFDGSTVVPEYMNDIPPSDDYTVMPEDDSVPPSFQEDVPQAQFESEEDLSFPPEDDLSFTPEEDFDSSFQDEGLDTSFQDDSGTPSGFAPQGQPKAEKLDKVQDFVEAKAALKVVSERIQERRAELRDAGVKGKEQLRDSELATLLDQKTSIDNVLDGFDNILASDIDQRIKGLGRFGKHQFTLYVAHKFGQKTPVKTTIKELFGSAKATGFTLTKRTKAGVHAATKAFAERMNKKVNPASPMDPSFFDAIKKNPATAVMFDHNGDINYNVAEAMHAAVNEYMLQEAGSLVGANRNDAEVGEVLGNFSPDQVSPEMMMMLAEGGITLKIAAADIGDKVLKNLGITPKSIQDREALQSTFGFNALQGQLGGLLSVEHYVPTEEERTRRDNPIKAKSIPILKASPELLISSKSIKNINKFMEDTLYVAIDRERSYRKHRKSGPRKVLIHRAGFQEAPKDHAKLVNKLEQTAFHVNTGHDVLMEAFTKVDGSLDTDALIRHIIGPASKATNYDDKIAYEAKKHALERSIEYYKDAVDDVGTGELFFNWFIARNHRIHLDSNTVNPQGDKHLARWLLTAKNSVKELDRDHITAVLEGKTDGMSQEDIMSAKMFAYGIVQAFDGADHNSIPTLHVPIPGIDKDNESEVLEAADILIHSVSDDDLIKMIHQADHVGHAALAVANLRKMRDSTQMFTSDMVLEVDGLTNGFAFRTVQFPVASEGSPVSINDWLEKVGILKKGSKYYDLESMNGARTMEQEDVYISVGQTFMDDIAGAKKKLNGTAKKWVALLEKHGRFPNFADPNDKDTKKFIRNLMKPPVMIFNYAAGIGKIANGLVSDQVLGKGYLGKSGLLSLLTAKENGEFVVTKQELVKTFGKTLGPSYHEARAKLHDVSNKASILDKNDQDIVQLKNHLYSSVGQLYIEPLKATLETLFSEQTVLNQSFTHAGQFMFDKFEEVYNHWRMVNPKATEQDKMTFLRDNAAILPGIAGASSDDQQNKLTFLKNVLDKTDNQVEAFIGGQRYSTNTVSRKFGDPGVGPAVLTVLSLDSSTLARALNEFYSGKAAQGALPVHDAIVLGAGEADLIQSYNRNFYTINRGYSIAEEFVKAIDNLERLHPDVVNSSISDIKGERISYSDMKTLLRHNVDKVRQGRQELFQSDIKSGQLVGPEGTMSQVDVATAKEQSLAFLASAAETIMNQMDDDKVRKALGKDYETHKKALHEMLKGCKR